MHWCFMCCMKAALVSIAIYQTPDLAFHFQYELFGFGLVLKFFMCASMTKPGVCNSENYLWNGQTKKFIHKIFN